MKRRGKITLGIAAAVVTGVTLFEAIPYSPLRSTFHHDADLILSAPAPGGTFTAAEIADLPEPARRHIEAAGFLGTPHIAAAVIDHPDTDLELDGRSLSIRYTQVNAVAEPTRWAFIDTRMYGIPFQGLEGYLEDHGRMRGVLGKAVTLFDEHGPDLDSGTLLTILAEALIFPDIALADYLSWEEVDATHARATLQFGDTTVDGVFAFGPDGLMTGFRTEERILVAPDGTRQALPWSVTTGEYEDHEDILRPGLIQAIWHKEDGDLIYFESRRPRYLTDLR